MQGCRRAIAVAFVLGLLAMPTTFAAEPSLVHLDWRSGSSLIGLHGLGHPAWNEVRFPFDVGPCHRDLRLDLLYEPASAGRPDGADPRIPYVFHAEVRHENGSFVSERILSEPRHGYPMGIVADAGSYLLQVRLEVGVAVEWDVRVRGLEVSEEPYCSLFLNEVETDPEGGDAGAEWVEIFNNGATDLDIGGFQVWGAARLGVDPAPFLVPDGTLVPSGGHVQVALPGREAFLDVNETVWFGDPAGRVLDRSPILTDDADDPRSWSRTHDGAHAWSFGRATPGYSNGT